MIPARGQSGATPGDVAIFLATVSLFAALLYPAWNARTRHGQLERAVADIEAIATSARSILSQSGAWPTPAEIGQAPPELSGLTGPDRPFGRVDYALEWRTWSVVDSVAAPTDAVASPGDAPPDSVGPLQQPVVRRVGGVALHSGDPALLAGLAEQYAETSFVLDSIWMLVLPNRAEVPAPQP